MVFPNDNFQKIFDNIEGEDCKSITNSSQFFSRHVSVYQFFLSSLIFKK